MTATFRTRSVGQIAGLPDPEVTKVECAGNAFERFARKTAVAMGRPAAFLVAVVIVVVWAVAGPFFHFSDTWQLAINTGTTIVTFLMVFLIQQSQNRDTLAIQVKLAELIIAMKGAHNAVATAETLSEEELQGLHADYRKKADETLATFETKGTVSVREAVQMEAEATNEAKPLSGRK